MRRFGKLTRQRFRPTSAEVEKELESVLKNEKQKKLRLKTILHKLDKAAPTSGNIKALTIRVLGYPPTDVRRAIRGLPAWQIGTTASVIGLFLAVASWFYPKAPELPPTVPQQLQMALHQQRIADGRFLRNDEQSENLADRIPEFIENLEEVKKDPKLAQQIIGYAPQIGPAH